ncbi:hypothetical protein [Motiliproteus sediminis]|uniref:hypothetical protein n=1 Tax=Motiliproteus sediminis TaxID=1468178 RepID=UPI001AEF6EE0|nr:hypothetical protein [Motiliproteus sediminis]
MRVYDRDLTPFTVVIATMGATTLVAFVTAAVMLFNTLINGQPASFNLIFATGLLCVLAIELGVGTYLNIGYDAEEQARLPS